MSTSPFIIHSPPDSFDKNFDSTFQSISSAATVSIVVGTIGTVAIVIAIIYCLKRAADAIPAYAQANLTVGRKPDPVYAQLPSHDAMDYSSSEHRVRVISDSQVENETMERFLSNMAKQKPIRFSPHQLSECTQNFSKVLGSGGFGVVYKGEFPNGVVVAVKVLKDNTSKRAEEQFMAEVGTMGRTYHINLVRLYGFCFDTSMRALVYEYMPNGSLDKFLFGQETQPIGFAKLHEIAIGTAKGLAYLHEECQQRIIHYDIKPGNVLLDSDLNPKVADFGLAKLCNRDSTHVALSGCRGTPRYAAPELWTPYPVTHKCDVYSFGMLLFEIVGKRRNHDANLSGTSQEWLPKWAYEKFEAQDLTGMLQICGIQEEEREKAERTVKVALWCVQYLPKARPMMSTVVKMLEGGVEIELPPSPFDHLQDPTLVLDTDSNWDSDHGSLLSKSKETQLGIKLATM